MATNIYQKDITLTSAWQLLTPTKLVLNATFQVPDDNYGPVEVRINADNAHISQWGRGGEVCIDHVDLATIEVRGNAGDHFLVVASSA